MALPGPKPAKYWIDGDFDQLRAAIIALQAGQGAPATTISDCNTAPLGISYITPSTAHGPVVMAIAYSGYGFLWTRSRDNNALPGPSSDVIDQVACTGDGVISYRFYAAGAWTTWRPEPWTQLTPLLNGWTGTAYYRKGHDGRVTLSGILAGGSLNQNLFVLPAGYRPGRQEYFPINATAGFGVIGVAPTGAIQQNVGNTSQCCLDGISFYAEQ